MRASLHRPHAGRTTSLHRPHTGQNGNRPNGSGLRDGRSAQRDRWSRDRSPEKPSSVPSAHAGRAGRAYVPRPWHSEVALESYQQAAGSGGLPAIVGQEEVLNQPCSPTMPPRFRKAVRWDSEPQTRGRAAHGGNNRRRSTRAAKRPGAAKRRSRVTETVFAQTRASAPHTAPTERGSPSCGVSNGPPDPPRSPGCTFQTCWKLPAGA